MDIWKIEPGRAAVAMATDEKLPGTGYVWLDLAYGEVEHLQREVEIGPRHAPGVGASLEVVVVRPRVAGGLGGQQLLLLRSEGDPQGLGDVAGDLVLHLEDVGELAVVALGPHRGAGARLDELGRDAKPVRRSEPPRTNCAFSCSPTSGPVTDLSRKATTAARGKTRSSFTFDSSVMTSSVMPSRKYSSSFAPLRFSK